MVLGDRNIMINNSGRIIEGKLRRGIISVLVLFVLRMFPRFHVDICLLYNVYYNIYQFQLYQCQDKLQSDWSRAMILLEHL